MLSTSGSCLRLQSLPLTPLLDKRCQASFCLPWLLPWLPYTLELLWPYQQGTLGFAGIAWKKEGLGIHTGTLPTVLQMGQGGGKPGENVNHSFFKITFQEGGRQYHYILRTVIYKNYIESVKN